MRNNKVQIDQAVLRVLYVKYKEYLIPVIVFAISLFVFVQFALPQFQTLLSEKDQIIANEQTLAVMTQNYNFIASQDDSELQSLLNIANTALPPRKDFAGILTAISNAAGLSGVLLNDYTFQIGNLSAVAAASPDQEVVKITLNINGTLDQTKKFLVALQNQVPISEVTSIDIISASSASINADFYYSPLPNISFDGTNPLIPITASEKKMLQGLSNPASPTTQTNIPVTNVPTVFPTTIPRSIPTVLPTAIPTTIPTVTPTAAFTPEPTLAPL